MSEWQNLNIGSICKKIIDYRGKTPEKVSYGTKLITSKVIKNNRILDNANFEYIRDDKYEEVMRRGKPELFDILFTTEAPLGEVALIKNDEKIAIAQRIILLRANTDKVTPHFLFYSLIGPLGYGRIQQKGTGTTVLGIKNPELKKVILPIPPLPTQRKIAKILSNYDDLIENNLKRIKLLEESARLTYEEWFLRFRIDGKKLEIDPDTKLPFGWELVKVGSLLQRVGSTAKIKSSEILESGTNPVVDQSTDFIAGYTNETNINQYIDNPFIVFGDHTRILKFVNFSFARGADGTQILISNNSRMPQTLFYHSLIAVDLSNYHYARHFKFLKEEKIILPKEDIATKYNDRSVVIFSQVKNLRHQNQLLKEARDILLPRLMTGMIDTNDMDIAI